MCNKVSLHEETKAFLGKTNYDCLCNDCLLEVDNLVSRVAVDQSDEIAEGKDYYMDNGLVVYTEMYHIKRGYCCNSGCRHCAYGFKRIE